MSQKQQGQKHGRNWNPNLVEQDFEVDPTNLAIYQPNEFWSTPSSANEAMDFHKDNTLSLQGVR